MESTPVVGVEIRKESTAPLLAPSLRRDIAAGITEQEQRGSGIPNREAFTTEKKLLLPRCLLTVSVFKKTWSIPAKKNPNNKYGDILLNRRYDSFNIPVIVSAIICFHSIRHISISHDPCLL
jgi:hypothetical protein